jgi:hypothetical protein
LEAIVKRILTRQLNNRWKMVQGKWLLVFVLFFVLSGCSLWNSYLDPDYQSSRADRLCHPYGECLQGTWVAVHGSAKDVTEAKTQCREELDRRYGNGWWKDSVARGLEIGTCMENKGYRLQQ